MIKKGRVGGIYCIYSKVNGKEYIGSAHYIKSRIASHFCALRENKHHSIILQNHFNKYGEEDLEVRIVEELFDADQLVPKEQHYIDTLKPRFNVCKIAGNCVGRPMLESTRQKLVAANLGKRLTEEHKEKLRITSTGRKHTPEAIEKLKLINKGRVRSKETREKLSKINKGKKATPETIENMRKAWFRDEHKNRAHLLRVSETNKGRKWTPEYRAHMESIMCTPEYKAKISAAGKGRPWSDTHREAYYKAIEARKLKSA